MSKDNQPKPTPPKQIIKDGYIRGGANPEKSQIPERPAAPQPIPKKPS